MYLFSTINSYSLVKHEILDWVTTVWRETLAGETLANLANGPWFAKLKPSKLVLIINNLLADLLIRQTFFCQMLETSQFVKLSPCQTFSVDKITVFRCNYNYMHKSAGWAASYKGGSRICETESKCRGRSLKQESGATAPEASYSPRS